MSAHLGRVLVVDDNENNRDILARRLTRNGYAVTMADSARNILERISDEAVDLVLLDIEMPDMSGWDVLEELKADPELSAIPVVMVTIVDHEALGLARGAANYLMKPIDRDRLAVVLDKHCARPDQQVPDLALNYGGSR